jgi:LUD domain
MTGQIKAMDENLNWHRKTILDLVARNLRKNNFSVYIEDTSEAALARVLELVKPGESVAFGGSLTAQTLGIQESLEKRGTKVITTMPGMSREEGIKIRRQSLAADVFIASPNAVTLDGKLLFMDKIGNRTAGMMFGPAKAIAVAGFNKIAADGPAARKRVELIAGPVNAKRLKLRTPCAETGVCSDCSSPDRICNISMTLLKKPSYTEYHVILVPEELGY